MTAELLMATQLPELSTRILDVIGKQGRLTISQLTTLTSANRNTVKKHLQALVKAGHIASHGKGRATWYALM